MPVMMAAMYWTQSDTLVAPEVLTLVTITVEAAGAAAAPLPDPEPVPVVVVVPEMGVTVVGDPATAGRLAVATRVP